MNVIFHIQEIYIKELVGRVLVSCSLSIKISDKFLPPFVSGSGYLFPADVVPCLYAQGIKTPLVHLEDVFITGVVGYNKCGLQLIDNKRHFKHIGYDLPCKPNHNDILIHEVNSKNEMHMWHNIILNNTIFVDCDQTSYF